MSFYPPLPCGETWNHGFPPALSPPKKKTCTRLEVLNILSCQTVDEHQSKCDRCPANGLPIKAAFNTGQWIYWRPPLKTALFEVCIVFREQKEPVWMFHGAFQAIFGLCTRFAWSNQMASPKKEVTTTRMEGPSFFPNQRWGPDVLGNFIFEWHEETRKPSRMNHRWFPKHRQWFTSWGIAEDEVRGPGP